MHGRAGALDPVRTRLAAPCLISDEQRFLVEHCPLDAWPRAAVDAELLAHQATEDIRGGSQDADGEPCLVWGAQVPKLTRQRWRVGEVEDPRPAGRDRDGQPDRVLGRFPGDLGRPPRRTFQPKLGVAVAFDEPFDVLEQVGPNRLRAGVSAPRAPDRRRDEEQADPGHDKEPGDVIELVRPDLDREHVKAARGQVDEHRLVRRIGPTVPAKPRGDIINDQGDGHHQPLEAAERSVDRLGKDLAALLEQVLPGPGQMVRAGHGCVPQAEPLLRQRPPEYRECNPRHPQASGHKQQAS